MRIGDVLFFSPRYRFEDLNLDDARMMIAALNDRVAGFYLAPASRLLAANDAFAAGLLCCAAVDFVALCSGKNPETWLYENIGDFGKESIANQFWRRFRHGLVHEGRIKSFGEFSLDFPNLVTVIGPALIVNPQRLLEAVQRAFASYVEHLDENDTARLLNRLRRYFNAEVELAKAKRSPR